MKSIKRNLSCTAGIYPQESELNVRVSELESGEKPIQIRMRADPMLHAFIFFVQGKMTRKWHFRHYVVRQVMNKR